MCTGTRSSCDLCICRPGRAREGKYERSSISSRERRLPRLSLYESSVASTCSEVCGKPLNWRPPFSHPFTYCIDRDVVFATDVDQLAISNSTSGLCTMRRRDSATTEVVAKLRFSSLALQSSSQVVGWLLCT